MKRNKQILDLSVSYDGIRDRIYIVRGEKVMFDFDLARLYQVGTKVLNQAVKRNITRFPKDFVFPLTIDEKNLMSQIVTSSYGGRRKPIFAFTEQGIAMLSSVLRSKRAIQVNVQIMRTFTKLRQMLSSHEELKEKIEQLEKKYDGQFEFIFKTIQQFLLEEEQPKKRLGFDTSSRKLL